MTICLALLTGCDGRVIQQTRPAQDVAGPQPPTTRPAEREVMAHVNGRPVYMDVLQEMLLSGPGSQFALELVRHEMVHQAAEKMGITVTQADLKAEHGRFLNAAFPQIEAKADRESALVGLLEQKLVSRKQWDMSIRTSALLRRMADSEVKITETDLSEEYARQYGRQVVIRHIQTAGLADAQQVKALAANQDFGELVAKYSINPSATRGGTLPPIGQDTQGVPPALRQAALAMKHLGEISDPVQVGTTFHILRLEQIIVPKKAKLEEVRGTLMAELKERRIRLYQKALLERLIREARVEYVNPTLKARDEAAKLRQGVVE